MKRRKQTDFAEARALDATTGAILQRLKRLAPYMDADFDYESSRWSPSELMIIRFMISTKSNDPQRIVEMHRLANGWLKRAKDLFLKGMVADPFGPERAAPPPTQKKRSLDDDRRDRELTLLERCEHDMSRHWHRTIAMLRSVMEGGRGFSENADQALEELKFIYRAQLPFGIGRDDPPINLRTGKLTCQPLFNAFPEEGWRLTWDGQTRDY